MKYATKRFSVTGYTQSEEIHEETVNGKTKGSVVLSHGKYKTGKKPVKEIIKIKYHA